MTEPKARKSYDKMISSCLEPHPVFLGDRPDRPKKIFFKAEGKIHIMDI